MKDRRLEKKLRNTLDIAVEQKRMEETIALCKNMTRNNSTTQQERRTNFTAFLSDVIRFEGGGTILIQAIVLLFVCAGVVTVTDIQKSVPVFVPLFILTSLPLIYRSQIYGMLEIEAVTRASNVQIILAKIILVSAINIICLTIVLYLEVLMLGNCARLIHLILYALVPLLVGMVEMLRSVRKGKKLGGIIVYILTMCVMWRCIAFFIPKLYETSAISIWIVAFLAFSIFFINELRYLIQAGKEGRMYGVIN